MSFLKYVVSHFSGRRTRSNAIDEQERFDAGLPMGGRIGGLIMLPKAQFALLDHSLVEVPSVAQMQIVAVSRVRMDAAPELGIFRFFTTTGIGRMGKGQQFLQVICPADRPEEIIDVAFYQFLCRIVPTTREAQAPFRGEGYGLGESTFTMGEDLQGEIPSIVPRLADLTDESGDIVFCRDGGVGVDYVKPYCGTENRLDDPQGVQGSEKSVSFMQYLRDLPQGHQERLLISFDHVVSLDGEPHEAVHVDYAAGLSLEPNKVQIL